MVFKLPVFVYILTANNSLACQYRTVIMALILLLSSLVQRIPTLQGDILTRGYQNVYYCLLLYNAYQLYRVISKTDVSGYI